MEFFGGGPPLLNTVVIIKLHHPKIIEGRKLDHTNHDPATCHYLASTSKNNACGYFGTEYV